MASSKKQAMFTLEYIKSRLHYDPDTGVFRWLYVPGRDAWNTRWAGKIAGSRQPDCVNITLDKNLFKAHQLAWFYMTGAWPTRHIDHRDKYHHNNRWLNLRLAEHGQNLMNRSKTVRNTTGFKGVTFDKSKGKFQAQINAEGRHYFLGRFSQPEDASAAYEAAAKRLHGEFARTT